MSEQDEAAAAGAGGDETREAITAAEEARADSEALHPAPDPSPEVVIPGAPPTAQPRAQFGTVAEAIAGARAWIQDQRRWSRSEKIVAEQAVAYLEAVLGA